MIFLTVGTHEPFDRLVRAVDAWCAETPEAEVFGQITDPGPSGYRPENLEWESKMTPERHESIVRDSQFVISHAGIGSMIAAMSLSKPIVVLPRRSHLRETRNDHQYATAQRWQSRPGVFVAFDEAGLPGVLDRILNRTGGGQTATLPAFASEELTTADRDLIYGRTNHATTTTRRRIPPMRHGPAFFQRHNTSLRSVPTTGTLGLYQTGGEET